MFCFTCNDKTPVSDDSQREQAGSLGKVGYWASPQHLVLEQPFISNFSNVWSKYYRTIDRYPYNLLFQLCIINGSGLWMNVAKWVDSEVGSVSGDFSGSSGSSEVTFVTVSPENSSVSGSPDVSSISSGSSFEEYLESMTAEMLKEHNV